MTRKGFVYPLFGLVVLLIAALACASDNTGTKVDEQAPAATEAAPTLETFKVGDVIEVEDHTIVLNSATISGGTLQANYTIENIGTSEIAVSSLLSFEARDDDGAKLEIEIFDCDSGIDGTVLPGDKLRGNICWSGVTTDSAKLYYKSDLFGSGAVIWVVQQ